MLSVDTAPPVYGPSVPQTDSTAQDQTSGDFGMTLETEFQKLDTSTSSEHSGNPEVPAAHSGPSAVPPLEVQEIVVTVLPGSEAVVDHLGHASALPPGSKASEPSKRRTPGKEGDESISTAQIAGQSASLPAILVLAWGPPGWQKLPGDVNGHETRDAGLPPAPTTAAGSSRVEGSGAGRLIAPALARPDPTVVGGPSASDTWPPLHDAAGAEAGLTFDTARLTEATSLPQVSPDSQSPAGLSTPPDPRELTSVAGGATRATSGAAENPFSHSMAAVPMEQVDGTESVALPVEVARVADSVSAENAYEERRSLDEIGWEAHTENTLGHAATQKGKAAIASGRGLEERGDEGQSQADQQNQNRAEGQPVPAASRSIGDPGAGQSLDHAARPAVNATFFADAQMADATSVLSSTVSGSVSHGVSNAQKADAVLLHQSQQWSEIEKSSVLSQLIEKARVFHWEHNSEIVISLKPEALGRISLRAAIVDQKIVATLVAESDRVRNILELELPALHRLLQQDGVPAKIEVIQGRELNFAATGGGQSNLHQNPAFRQSDEVPGPWALDNIQGKDLEPADYRELRDSRYLSRSIHLIA